LPGEFERVDQDQSSRCPRSKLVVVDGISGEADDVRERTRLQGDRRRGVK
jgi:hypothetical protein